MPAILVAAADRQGAEAHHGGERVHYLRPIATVENAAW